jgi:hypothetical protein
MISSRKDKVMPNYVALIKDSDGDLIEQIHTVARNRKHAVTNVLNRFYRKYAKYGWNATDHLTVNDPVNEVYYHNDFNCGHRQNRYLDAKTTDRLIDQSKGELMVDRRAGSTYHPRMSVKRQKRRRRATQETIFPHIIRIGKILYYRVTIQPQKSRKGQLLSKRKYKDIRLSAKSVKSALLEIVDRRLHETNNSSQVVGTRDADFLAKLVKTDSFPGTMGELMEILEERRIERLPVENRGQARRALKRIRKIRSATVC